jgi:rubredoxin
MTIYRCLNCNGYHGQTNHQEVKHYVQPITQFVRDTYENRWQCPNCGQNNRTTDGTLLGQSVKMYEEITEQQVLLLEQRQMDDWIREGGMRGYRSY